ncbi:MAG: F0F1 ATP synthase subunit B [Dysgonamonadaceae bacterium]|jgi:F-type H+-transporting ATPase subunit b|nr:F0F1 ATP synthase subunit B [Dysgonamonadaceae bacterium]
MSLLTPDSGLLFWMLFSFGIVFFVLYKFGWPVITKMVEDRSQYVESALEAAKEAKLQVESVREEGAKILAEARNKEMQLLKDGADMRDKMVEDAKQLAQVEADKMIQEARVLIQKEKDNAIKDIKKQVALLSVDIAEKILRKNLDNQPAQIELIDKLLEETITN